MTQHQENVTSEYVGEEWLNPFEICAVHIRNCAPFDMIAGRSVVPIGGGLNGIPSYNICQGDKGALQIQTGAVQGWLVKLPEPLSEDMPFGASWFNADGDEFVVIGTHDRCGEYFGNAARVGDRCIKVIASCCI